MHQHHVFSGRALLIWAIMNSACESSIVKLAMCVPCIKEHVQFMTEALLAHRLCAVLQTRQAWMRTRVKLETAAHQSPAEHG